MSQVHGQCLAAIGDRLRAWADQAALEEYLNLPSIQVTATHIESGKTAASLPAGRAAAVIVGRGERGEESPLGMAVVRIALGPMQVVLSWTEVGWVLENRTPAPLRVILHRNGTRTSERIPPGRRYQSEGKGVEYDLHGYRYQLRAADAGSRPTHSGLTCSAEEACPREGTITRVAVLGCELAVWWPPGTTPGEAALARRVLARLWYRIADELHLDADPPVDIDSPDACPAAGPGPVHYLCIRSELLGGSPLRLAVPGAFCARCLHAEQIRSSIRWTCQVVIGGQELLLDQLKKLGPDMVVKLRPDSAALIDDASGRTWALIRNPSDRISGEATYTIGGPVPRRVRNGAPVSTLSREIDIQNVDVLLQVIAAAETVAVPELENYAPGATLKVSLRAGQAVSIAINGRVLGQGKLVDLDGALGVRVVGWNV
jgi:flagellar motor switch/type III secretory pathway protein FliN